MCFMKLGKKYNNGIFHCGQMALFTKYLLSFLIFCLMSNDIYAQFRRSGLGRGRGLIRYRAKVSKAKVGKKANGTSLNRKLGSTHISYGRLINLKDINHLRKSRLKKARSKGHINDVIDHSNKKEFFHKYKSEWEARHYAKKKLGKNAVKVGDHKWRSANGKWQYRAAPGDIKDSHVNLEELDPKTGKVLQNLHLKW